jgi:hypothetical protein
MSKDSARQAWTKLVEERECEAKQPRVKKRVKEEVSQAELDAELDDLVTEHVFENFGSHRHFLDLHHEMPAGFLLPAGAGRNGLANFDSKSSRRASRAEHRRRGDDIFATRRFLVEHTAR